MSASWEGAWDNALGCGGGGGVAGSVGRVGAADGSLGSTPSSDAVAARCPDRAESVSGPGWAHGDSSRAPSPSPLQTDEGNPKQSCASAMEETNKAGDGSDEGDMFDVEL